MILDRLENSSTWEGQAGTTSRSENCLDFREVDRAALNWPLGSPHLPFRRKGSYWWIGGSAVGQVGSECMR